MSSKFSGRARDIISPHFLAKLCPLAALHGLMIPRSGHFSTERFFQRIQSINFVFYVHLFSDTNRLFTCFDHLYRQPCGLRRRFSVSACCMRERAIEPRKSIARAVLSRFYFSIFIAWFWFVVFFRVNRYGARATGKEASLRARARALWPLWHQLYSTHKRTSHQSSVPLRCVLACQQLQRRGGRRAYTVSYGAFVFIGLCIVVYVMLAQRKC